MLFLWLRIGCPGEYLDIHKEETGGYNRLLMSIFKICTNNRTSLWNSKAWWWREMWHAKARWSNFWFHLQELTDVHLSYKFLAFYGNRTFITMFRTPPPPAGRHPEPYDSIPHRSLLFLLRSHFSILPCYLLYLIKLLHAFLFYSLHAASSHISSFLVWSS